MFNIFRSLLCFSLIFTSLGSLFFSNPALAEDSCMKMENKQQECYPKNLTLPDPSYSYSCVVNKGHCTTLLSGEVVEQDGKSCPVMGKKNICCKIPVCSEDDDEEDDEEDDDEEGDGGNQPIPQTGSTENWSYGVPGGLRLVGCTKTGNCELVDIVQQGIYFADFLIGLSGALFLIAFIWGGAMYLLSFGRKEWVNKGRNAMVKSAIGIVLIILAWTIVTFVAESLGYTGL